jgi:hypothetical protein
MKKPSIRPIATASCPRVSRAGRPTLNLLRAGVLAISLFAAGFLPNASADIANYRMTWDSVDGTNAGIPFTDQELTLEFSNFDTANLSYFSIYPIAYFTNGANITVTLGSILTDAALDDDPLNTGVLLGYQTNRIFYGHGSGGTYDYDRGSLSSILAPPATTLDIFETTWDSTGTSGTSIGWSMKIGGQTLSFTSLQTGTGSFAAVVPEPGTFALLLVGGALVAFRYGRGVLTRKS